MFAIERFMNEVKKATKEFEDDGVEVLSVQIDTHPPGGPKATFTIRAAEFFRRYWSEEPPASSQS